MPVTSTYSSSGSRYIQPPASQFSKSSFSDRVYYSPLLNSTKTSSFRNSSLYRNSSTTSLRNNSSYVSNIRNTALCGAEIYQRYSLSTYKPAASVSSRITQLSLAYSGRFPKANSASSSLETSSTDLSEEKLHNSRSKETVNLRAQSSLESSSNSSYNSQSIDKHCDAKDSIDSCIQSSSAIVTATVTTDDLMREGYKEKEIIASDSANLHVSATIRIKPQSNIRKDANANANSIMEQKCEQVKRNVSASDKISKTNTILTWATENPCDDVSSEKNQFNRIPKRSNVLVGNDIIRNVNKNVTEDVLIPATLNEASKETDRALNKSIETSKECEDDQATQLQPRINLNKQQTSPKTNEREDDQYPNKSPSSARIIKPSLNYERCTEVHDSLRNTREGLCGLWNIGNTCFMNSMIQCLSHTRELTSFLRGQSSSERGTSKDHLILAEYTKLIKNMWSGTQRSINPSDLKYAFSSKHRMYSGSAQQDAQEFLRFFLDSLHGALNAAIKRDPLSEIDDNMNNKDKADMLWEWYSKAENSMIKDLFVGQLRSTLKCTFCNMESTMFDPFWDLSLPLPSSSSRCKLENCLEMFIKEEIMDGIDQPTCSNCDTRRKCTKRLTIERFPRYLVIHLKRFSEARWSKLTNIVEFPTKNRALNLQPYASEDISGPIYYSLYGISNHMGSTAGGHYVAVCKHPQTQQWNEFNDNYVTEAFERNLVTSNAYVLFYERA
ncbi:ubiquitin carboxyl-terminal hydrolase 8 isoform X2 [Anopheles gambiae]|uniref:ubiquitin carboxyl-terminal hydrolase 8 isoform X2 n=2 Tax=Anopheles gambiae TaxID=7165 RepID=UPI002AC8B388|nr:ubiquitin carboxyl-terminal hydrolase 8 isoform X2 [Anopheles gambiae]